MALNITFCRRRSNWCAALCELDGEIYNIVIGDWGTARWSGAGTDAKHVYTQSGHSHKDLKIQDLAKESVMPVGTMELQVAFGFQAKK